MSEIFSHYIFSFLHPWHTQEVLRSNRLVRGHKETQLELVPTDEREKALNEIGVSFEQSLTISWLFVIMNGFYVLIGYFVGLNIFKSFGAGGEEIFLDDFQSYLSFVSILLLLGKIVFFPLVFWLYGKFWINMIKIFSTLFEKEGDVDRASEEIVSNAFTSHAFLVIPIFGELLFRITNLVYLYGGLRRNLNYSSLQAGIVIICPLLLFLFLIFLLMLSIGMAFSGF